MSHTPEAEVTVIGTTVNHLPVPKKAVFTGLRYDADGYPHARIDWGGVVMLEFATRDAVDSIWAALRDAFTEMSYTVRMTAPMTRPPSDPSME